MITKNSCKVFTYRMASNEPEDVKENLDDLVTELNSIVVSLSHVSIHLWYIKLYKYLNSD